MIIYTVNHTHSNTLIPDRPQQYLPIACVIAQQYSPATFVALRFNSLTEIFCAFQNNYLSFSFLKLR